MKTTSPTNTQSEDISCRIRLVAKALRPLLESAYGPNQGPLVFNGLVERDELLMRDFIKYRGITFNDALKIRALAGFGFSFCAQYVRWSGYAPIIMDYPARMGADTMWGGCWCGFFY